MPTQKKCSSFTKCCLFINLDVLCFITQNICTLKQDMRLTLSLPEIQLQCLTDMLSLILDVVYVHGVQYHWTSGNWSILETFYVNKYCIRASLHNLKRNIIYGSDLNFLLLIICRPVCGLTYENIVCFTVVRHACLWLSTHQIFILSIIFW